MIMERNDSESWPTWIWVIFVSITIFVAIIVGISLK
jgi:hypothetical protein